MDMHPFNLEAAKHGQPVCTRDGRKVRIICFDYKGDANAYPILALISTTNQRGVPDEIITKYTEDGKYARYISTENNEDLMMAPRRKEGWINVYKSVNPIFKSEAEAKAHNDDYANYIGTFKIEWEE